MPSSRRLAAPAADTAVPAGPRRPAPTLGLVAVASSDAVSPDTEFGVFTDAGPWVVDPEHLPWRRHQAVLRAALTASIPHLVRDAPCRRAPASAPPSATSAVPSASGTSTSAARVATPRWPGSPAACAPPSRSSAPTYIKLGQIVASGDGVFPPELVAEFKWCRDQVPAEPWPVVERILTEELGRPLAEVFASVEHTPLAAASIAQVHAATLLDGTAVVIKVQRPTVARRVRQDLAVMAWVAPHLIGRIPVAALANPPALVELFAETIVEELDFRLEAENMLSVARVFAELGQRSFVVPRPIPPSSPGACWSWSGSTASTSPTSPACGRPASTPRKSCGPA